MLPGPLLGRAPSAFRWSPLRGAAVWRGTVGGCVIGVVLLGGLSLNSLGSDGYLGYLLGLEALFMVFAAAFGAVGGAVVTGVGLLLHRVVLRRVRVRLLWEVVTNVALAAAAAFGTAVGTTADLFDGTVFGGALGAGAVAGLIGALTAVSCHVSRQR